jgi:hypothetical protein
MTTTSWLLMLVAIVAGGGHQRRQQERMVSWWFAPAPGSGASHHWAASGNVSAATELLRRHGGQAIASSLLLYCGDTIASNGSFVEKVDNSACDHMAAAAAVMRIGVERVIQTEHSSSGCSGAMRAMFRAPAGSIGQIAQMARRRRLHGVSWDVECTNSTPRDAADYATYLSRLRAALAPNGARLTSYTNVYAPMIADPASLQSSVDRILVGDTYNYRATRTGETNFSGWLHHYRSAAVNPNISRAEVGVGVLASTLRGDWNCDVGAMAKRLEQLATDHVPELAIFMLKTSSACNTWSTPPPRNIDGDPICPCTEAWIPFARKWRSGASRFETETV